MAVESVAAMNFRKMLCYVAAAALGMGAPGREIAFEADAVAYDAEGGKLLLAQAGGVAAVDTATGKAAMLLKLDDVAGILLLPDGKRGVATGGTGRVALLFDIASGAELARIPTGMEPGALVWEPATRTVWVMNRGDGTATVIDPAAAKIVSMVRIGGRPGAAVADGSGLIYVNMLDAPELRRVDAGAQKTLRATELPGCQPSGLALTAQGQLISACRNGAVRMTDAKTLLPTGVEEIGSGGGAVAYDPARNRAYVATDAGTVAVIDTSFAPPVRRMTIPTQPFASQAAIDPASGRVFVAGGSEVLVVAP